MQQGWFRDDYYILFDEGELPEVNERYRVAGRLPGYTVVGLKGWDDFIVRDERRAMFVVPTVPAVPSYLAAFTAPDGELKRDPRWEDKVKWWVKPLIFGGDPRDDSNATWVSLEDHAQLVRWWNDLYQSIKC